MKAPEGAGWPQLRRLAQDWQSAGVRGVSFFSVAYFAAADLTIGLMIWSSACSQSLVKSSAEKYATEKKLTRRAPADCQS